MDHQNRIFQPVCSFSISPTPLLGFLTEVRENTLTESTWAGAYFRVGLGRTLEKELHLIDKLLITLLVKSIYWLGEHTISSEQALRSWQVVRRLLTVTIVSPRKQPSAHQRHGPAPHRRQPLNHNTRTSKPTTRLA